MSFDHSVTFILEGAVEVNIEGPFVLTAGSEIEQLIDIGSTPSLLAPLLRLNQVKVRSGSAFDDGHLEVTFDDGTKLLVPAGGQYESWQITGPEGPLIVSMPGGELAVW